MSIKILKSLLRIVTNNAICFMYKSKGSKRKRG